MIPENSRSGDFTFPAQEKLKSKKSIQSLFESRNYIQSSHLKVVFKINTAATEHLPKFSVSVPKRAFKKAVNRNKLKRLIREAYRLNKSPLVEYCKLNSISVEMMWIYTKSEMQTFHFIEPILKTCIGKLMKYLIAKSGN